MTRPEVVEVERYYQQGRKKRINFLCYNLNIFHNNNDCYSLYLKDLGLKLTVSDWRDETYQTIKSVIMSCPVRFPYVIKDKKTGDRMYLPSSYHYLIEEKEEESSLYNNVIPFEYALKIAYRINPTVRSFLHSVDNRLPDSKVISLNNPRVYDIVWELIYLDKDIECLTPDKAAAPLTFTWNKERITI
jgi:hypothetical protein